MFLTYHEYVSNHSPKITFHVMDGWVKQTQDFHSGDNCHVSRVKPKVNVDLFNFNNERYLLVLSQTDAVCTKANQVVLLRFCFVLFQFIKLTTCFKL